MVNLIEKAGKREMKGYKFKSKIVLERNKYRERECSLCSIRAADSYDSGMEKHFEEDNGFM